MDRSDYEQRVPELDPSGVLSHLIEEIQASLRAADKAEKLLISLVQTAVEKGTFVDSVAAELRISMNDALVLGRESRCSKVASVVLNSDRRLAMFG